MEVQQTRLRKGNKSKRIGTEEKNLSLFADNMTFHFENTKEIISTKKRTNRTNKLVLQGQMIKD